MPGFRVPGEPSHGSAGSQGRCDALIEALGLEAMGSWSAQALSVSLRSLASSDWVTVVDAELRGDNAYAVTYRRPSIDGIHDDWVLGTVGDRDEVATLRLMPHFESEMLPIDAETYGRYFAIVGVEEPFGPNNYMPPDAAGVRWFVPPDFGNS